MPRTNRHLLDAVAEIAAAQHGLVSAVQLSEIGFARSTLRHRIRQGGAWSRVLPGVYSVVSAELTPRQQLTAGFLYAGRPSALTGISAMRLYGLSAVARLAAREVHLIVPTPRKRVSHGFVHIERCTAWPTTRLIDGVEVASIPRAAIDACRRLDRASPVRALLSEIVQTERASQEQLEAELAHSQRRRSALAREALRLMRQGPASAPEMDLHDRWLRSELPDALWNVDLHTPSGAFIARPDVYIPDLGIAVEVDSLQFHYSRPDWEATMNRHDRMTAHGLAVLHFTPARIRGDWPSVRREVVATMSSREGVVPPDVVFRYK